MSKNVKVNGVDYIGVSQVQLPATAGGTALFKDVDEITTPSGSVTITENGTHNVANYAQAVVAVESSGDGDDYRSLFNGMVDGTVSGDVVLPASVTNIRDYAFSKTQITSIEIPAVTNIGEAAFEWCESLVLTELPETLQTIGRNCFYGAKNVAITEIPASVTELTGAYAFYMTASKTLTFKGTPTTIHASALGGVDTVNVPWAEGAVEGAPWGAGTINYNYTGE